MRHSVPKNCKKSIKKREGGKVSSNYLSFKDCVRLTYFFLVTLNFKKKIKKSPLDSVINKNKKPFVCVFFFLSWEKK